MGNSMSLILQSSGGGQITVQEPTTASNFTQTLPAATGTVMVTGNMPAFSVNGNAQTISNATWTKISLQNEEFDTASAFDSTTNYRFQPVVAGYYQVCGAVYYGTTAVGSLLAVYKNGSEHKRGGTATGITGVGTNPAITALVYLNGSTDYVELYIYQNTGGSITTNGGAILQYFQGAMVRAA
jgi:hypothetical protein